MLPTLGVGGAELVLERVMTHYDRQKFDMSVVSLADGFLAEQFADAGIPTIVLGRSRRQLPSALVRLHRWMKSFDPDVVQTWMYHANLAAGLMARVSGRPPVVWNLRTSRFLPDEVKAATRGLARAGAIVSRSLPVAIVCPSQDTLDFHVAMGYDRSRMHIIPNGFAAPMFAPDVARAVRRELGVSIEAELVGRVARFDRQKDLETFAKAAGLLAVRRPRVRFVLCGEGLSSQNETLVRWLRDAGVLDRSHLLGRRSDVDRIHRALDVACSSSASEGFPNVLAEAMACGTPVVSTDAGDSREIVGDDRWVVPTRNPESLARAIDDLLSLSARDREELGDECQRRVSTLFGLDTMVRRYEQLYEGIVLR